MARDNQTGPLTRLLLRFLINTGALVAAAYILDFVAREVGFFAPNAIEIADWQSALATGVIFGLANALIRPLVSCFTCLLQVITLGLFTLIINALMLLLTSSVAEFLHVGFRVNGFGPAFFGAILVSIVSTLLTHALR